MESGQPQTDQPRLDQSHQGQMGQVPEEFNRYLWRAEYVRAINHKFGGMTSFVLKSTCAVGSIDLAIKLQQYVWYFMTETWDTELSLKYFMTFDMSTNFQGT